MEIYAPLRAGEHKDKFTNVVELLQTVVTKPIVSQFSQMYNQLLRVHTESAKENSRLVGEMGEMREKLRELGLLVKERVKKVEGAVIAKQKQRLKKKKMRLIDNAGFLKILKRAEDFTSNKKMQLRVKLGCLILYLTGMRIDCLRTLSKSWYEVHLSQEGGMLYYTPSKQRGEQLELGCLISKGNRELLFSLYLEYKKLYNKLPFSVARATLNTNINSVLNTLDEPITSHAFRCSVITKIAKRDNVVIAQQYIGHARLETTGNYVLNMIDIPQYHRITEGLGVNKLSTLVKGVAKKALRVRGKKGLRGKVKKVQ